MFFCATRFQLGQIPTVKNVVRTNSKVFVLFTSLFRDPLLSEAGGGHTGRRAWPSSCEWQPKHPPPHPHCLHLFRLTLIRGGKSEQRKCSRSNSFRARNRRRNDKKRSNARFIQWLASQLLCLGKKFEILLCFENSVKEAKLLILFKEFYTE